MFENKKKWIRPVIFGGIGVFAAVFFAGCDAERLRSENEFLKKEVEALKAESGQLQSEINRRTAERDEQRKLRRDLELENKKLIKRLKKYEGN